MEWKITEVGSGWNIKNRHLLDYPKFTIIDESANPVNTGSFIGGIGDGPYFDGNYYWFGDCITPAEGSELCSVGSADTTSPII